jgi:hypothetical protein
MTVVLVLAGAVLFPLTCLLFLLWMSHLEDTLTRDVHRARRRPEPPPILAIPVRRSPGPAGTIPAQRTAPPVEVTGADATVTT